MTDGRVVAALSGQQALALPVLADGCHLLTLHGVFSSSVKLPGGGESGGGDDRGDSRGDDRGDSRGDAVGDDRGDSRGDDRGDSRGDAVGDDRGDSGCDARGESRNDIRWGDRGDGRGDTRGDTCGDSPGEKYAGGGAPWRWWSRTPAERLWLVVAVADDFRQHRFLVRLQNPQLLHLTMKGELVLLAQLAFL